MSEWGNANKVCARCKRPIMDDQEWQYYQGRFWHEERQDGCEGL